MRGLWASRAVDAGLNTLAIPSGGLYNIGALLLSDRKGAAQCDDDLVPVGEAGGLLSCGSDCPEVFCLGAVPTDPH